jgi:hypothetical protein
MHDSPTSVGIEHAKGVFKMIMSVPLTDEEDKTVFI